MRLASGEQMREIDTVAITEWGLPCAALMESAGVKATESLLEAMPALAEIGGPVVIVCGKGNNGGDGFVVARHLANHSIAVHVVLLTQRAELTGDARQMAEVYGRMGEILEVADTRELDALCADAVVVVDAILGIGLTSAPHGLADAAITSINAAAEQGAFVLALDVPSGVNADNGEVPGNVVTADLCVTFGVGKVGVFSFPGAAAAGDVVVADIGFPAPLLEGLTDHLTTLEGLEGRLDLAPTAHKGDRGRVLVVGGSDRAPGAAALAAEGALRAGAGLVTVATTQAAASVVVASIREAMVAPMTALNGELHASNAEALIELAHGVDAVVLGPGLGRGPTELVRRLLVDSHTPIIVDADALNILAEHLDWLAAATAPLVLTPHPAEFGRLISCSAAEVNAHRVDLAREFAREHGLTVVLKGPRTLITSSDGRLVINPTIHSGLATAGSGDVLAGCVGALVAQGHTPADAAALGAFLHGQAGEIAAEAWGSRGFLAREIAGAIPKAIERVLSVTVRP